jgi:hypothetical protein
MLMPNSTVSNIVVLPGEYKERMSAGFFDPEFSSKMPDSQKPLIYVTHPDDAVHELWVPPVYESLRGDHQSDDETCSCDDVSIDTTPEDSLSEKQAFENLYDNRSECASNELWFYRTGWQNRAVHATNDKSSRMVYYADIPWSGTGTSLKIRRGHQAGEIVADIHRRGPGRPFEIAFTDSRQQPHLTSDNGNLVLKFGCIYSRTHKFTYRGRNLAWKQGFTSRRLKDLDTNEILAEFHSRSLTSLHKDGKMVFRGEYAKDPLWVDIIVVTALTCQQREREIRRTAGHYGGGN